MRILIISLAARGHAIADALSRSRHRPEIISFFPGNNPGIARLAVVQEAFDVLNVQEVLAQAKKYDIDFAFVAPDDAIGAGMTDALETIGIPSVAPRKSLARIETSKGFARALLTESGVGSCPKYAVFGSAEPERLNKFMSQELGGHFVVKYDALKGGKGVKVSGEHLGSIEEGVAYALECIRECGQVVIEEKLTGVEFSLMSFVSGTRVVDMPAVQDHKRAYEGDTGPNTGGMGTYSDADHSLPFLKREELERASEINRLTAEALQEKCNEPFKGILYGGYILTTDGVKVIEFNARFGDPEVHNVLPLLTSDFVDICLGIISGELSEDMVAFEHKATVCKYITPECYPVSKKLRGKAVKIPQTGGNSRIYFGDISEENGVLKLGGSRTAAVVGIGASIAEAERIAQSLCEQAEGPVRFRSDIGTAETIQKRIDLAESLRAKSAP